MPMSPRLLRPRASSALVAVDADAKAYISAVRTADGGQYMEAGVQRAIDAFVIGCKADGIWSAIRASCILIGARTLSGALTPLVGTAPTNNNFVSGDYNRKTGLVGDGVGKYLDTGRKTDADPQDSYHQAVYVTTTQSATVGYIGGGQADPGSSQITTSTNDIGFRCRSSSQLLRAGCNVAGFIGVNRSASSEFTTRAANTTETSVTASQAPISVNVLVFARSTTANAPGLFTTARMAFFSVGESLSLSSLDTRLTTLYNAIGAAIP